MRNLSGVFRTRGVKFQINPSQRSLCGKMTSCGHKTRFVIWLLLVLLMWKTGDGKESHHNERKPLRITEIKSTYYKNRSKSKQQRAESLNIMFYRAFTVLQNVKMYFVIYSWASGDGSSARWIVKQEYWGEIPRN